MSYKSYTVSYTVSYKRIYTVRVMLWELYRGRELNCGSKELRPKPRERLIGDEKDMKIKEIRS